MILARALRGSTLVAEVILNELVSYSLYTFSQDKLAVCKFYASEYDSHLARVFYSEGIEGTISQT